MKISEFVWDEKNTAHIWRHEVTPEEVESVTFDDDPHFRKHEKVRYVYGQAYNGKYLFVVLVLRSSEKAYVVTSREMDLAERRLYKKWKKEN